MKTILWILFFFIFGYGCYRYIEAHPQREYLVTIEFCDNRKPVKVIVESTDPPSNSDVSRYKVAVSEYAGYLNVCNISSKLLTP